VDLKFDHASAVGEVGMGMVKTADKIYAPTASINFILPSVLSARRDIKARGTYAHMSSHVSDLDGEYTLHNL